MKMSGSPVMISVEVSIGELTGEFEMDGTIALSPADAFLNALGSSDDFPIDINNDIVDHEGVVELRVCVGGEQYLELSDVVAAGAQKLSDCADEDNTVKLRLRPLKKPEAVVAVFSHDGATKLGEVKLPEGAKGEELLNELRAGFTGDVEAAIVEFETRKQGKWIALAGPFAATQLLQAAQAAVAALLIFIKPTTPLASIAQLRVCLPPGSAPKAASTDAPVGQPPAAAPAAPAAIPAAPAAPTAATAAAPAMVPLGLGLGKSAKAKAKEKSATAEEDEARVGKASCLQGDREQRFLHDPDGKLLIKFHGGGKYSCLLCDDPALRPPAAPPPELRALGQACSGLAIHLISKSGSGGHGSGHIKLHATMHGQTLSEADILAIRDSGSSKSYTGKRGTGSAQARAASIHKLARSAASPAAPLQLSPAPVAAPAPQGGPPATPHGAAMAAELNDL